jgi:hypothetical protein
VVACKRAVAVFCLALGLLVSPVASSSGPFRTGSTPALAKECALEIELCQEIDLVVYKTRACWKVRLFC